MGYQWDEKLCSCTEKEAIPFVRQRRSSRSQRTRTTAKPRRVIDDSDWRFQNRRVVRTTRARKPVRPKKVARSWEQDFSLELPDPRTQKKVNFEWDMDVEDKFKKTEERAIASEIDDWNL